jgi:hypothetical protein
MRCRLIAFFTLTLYFTASALAGIVTGNVTGTRHFELDLLAIQYNLIKSFAVDVGLDLHPKWTVI